MQLLTAYRYTPILREDEAEKMNIGMHIPVFETEQHGKLRFKTEIG